jgi:hypothetical protein
MPLFEKSDWPAYKAALRRIAETGMELERSEVAGAPEVEIAAQQFQAALSDYQQARAGLVDPLVDLNGDPGAEPGDWRSSDGYAELLQQGDGTGSAEPQQG